MADIKQLKIKIQSTKNIRKITNAMEVISTIKLQKVKKKTEHLREYMNVFLEMLASIDSYVSIFPKGKSVLSTKELIILVSSEKGLCGSLNTILFKQFASEYDNRKKDVAVYVVGKKAKDYCIRRGYSVVGSLSLKDKFQSDDLSDLYLFINNAWKASHYKSMKVYYNYFKNTMKQVPIGFQFFPLSVTSFEKFMSDLEISLPKKEKISNSSHIILEPNKRTIVKKAYDIMMNVIIYGAVLHNKTGEFASRMMAMKGAKDNATKITNDLTLAYNKARQDAITKEVLEIVSAKAVIED